MVRTREGRSLAVRVNRRDDESVGARRQRSAGSGRQNTTDCSYSGLFCGESEGLEQEMEGGTSVLYVQDTVFAI